VERPDISHESAHPQLPAAASAVLLLLEELNATSAAKLAISPATAPTVLRVVVKAAMEGAASVDTNKVGEHKVAVKHATHVVDTATCLGIVTRVKNVITVGRLAI